MTRCILTRQIHGISIGTYGTILEHCEGGLVVVIFNGQRYPHKLMQKYLEVVGQ